MHASSSLTDFISPKFKPDVALRAPTRAKSRKISHLDHLISLFFVSHFWHDRLLNFIFVHRQAYFQRHVTRICIKIRA